MVPASLTSSVQTHLSVHQTGNTRVNTHALLTSAPHEQPGTHLLKNSSLLLEDFHPEANLNRMLRLTGDQYNFALERVNTAVKCSG